MAEMKNKTCPDCKTANHPDAVECAGCGLPLPDESFYTDRTHPSPPRPEPQTLAFQEGQLIGGQYQVVRRIGEGGMGQVYLVRDELLNGEELALKIILPHFAGSPVFQDRFAHEVAAARILTHRNIVRVYDPRVDGNLRFFTMEYLDGRTLRDVLEEREEAGDRLRVNEVAGIGSQILDALVYAHGKGVVHRDLKPDNVMLVGEPPELLVKVLDFGLAKLLTPSQLSKSNSVLGAAGYMSPEQLSGKGQVDERSDLFSLGVILYEMLTFRLPSGRFKLPGELPGRRTKAFDDLLDRALQTEAQDRPASAREMKAELESIAEQAQKKEEEQAGRVEALRAEAENLAGQGEFAATLERLKAALNLDPENQALLALREEIEAAQRVEKERRAREREEAKQKRLEQARELLAEGRQSLARGDLERAAELSGRARQELNELPELAEEVDQLAADLSRARERQAEEARRKRELAKTLAAQAAELAKEGKYGEAKGKLREALQLLPGDDGLKKALQRVEGMEQDAHAKENEEPEGPVIDLDEEAEPEGEGPPPPDLRPDGPGSEKAGKTKRGWLPAVAVVLLLFLSVGGFFWYQSRQEELAARKSREFARYLEQAESAIATHDWRHAAEYLKRAVELRAGDQRVSGLRARLEKEKTEFAKKQKADQARQTRIAGLLQGAERDIAATRLASPAGSNALEKYREVLSLDPGNSWAKSGLQQIVAEFLKLAGRAIKEKAWSQATDYLAQADKAVADDTRVGAMRKELARARVEAERAARERAAKEQVQARQTRIAGLLQGAEKDITAARLTSPAGRNALEKYREVLSLDPGNSWAKSGLQQIVAEFLKLAGQAIKDKAWSQATDYLAQADKAVADDTRVGAMRKELARARVKAKWADRKRKQRELEARRKADEERRKREAEKATPKRFTNSLGMEFVLIPAGSFMMGSTDADLAQMKRDFKAATGKPFKSAWDRLIEDEQPAHRVRISKPYYMQTTEVTNDQFAAFSRATGYKTDAEKGGKGYVWKDGKWQWVGGAEWRHPSGPGSGISGMGSHPVVQVSWNDAQAFAQWLSRKEGVEYSLPTEAQWEYASRGGREGQLYSWGSEMPPRNQVGNFCDESFAREFGKKYYYILRYDDGHAKTAPVGNYQKNGFGLYDMIGNVWEWCQDWYGKYSSGSASDPMGPGSGRYRVVRGGSWSDHLWLLRSAGRDGSAPVNRGGHIGIRLARKK